MKWLCKLSFKQAQISHQRHTGGGTMKKTSALTAALSGKRSDATQSIAEEAAKHTDSFSFPCLDRSGKQSTSGLDDIAQELESSSLKDHGIAGSAPTAVILPNCSVAVSCNTLKVHSCWSSLSLPMSVPTMLQADYELNPYRRRGGEERVPTPMASVVGTHIAASGPFEVQACLIHHEFCLRLWHTSKL